MRPIKIFLASSINEFADERFILKDFKRRLNDVLVDNDVFVKLFICECADSSVSATGKQDEYDQEIDDSDIFIIIIGEKFGIHTKREYNRALKVRSENNELKIIAAFKDLKNISKDVIDEEAVNFKKESSDDGAMQIVFDETLRELKKALAEAIAEKLDSTVKMQVTDNAVIIRNKDGEAITAAKM